MPRTATPPKINPRANPAPRRLSVQPMSGDLVPVGDQGYDIPDEFWSYHWQQDTSCSPFKSAEEFKEVLGRSRVSTALPLLSAYEWTRPKVMLLSGVVSSASPPMVARVVFPGVVLLREQGETTDGEFAVQPLDGRPARKDLDWGKRAVGRP